jgi:hypothetical protein
MALVLVAVTAVSLTACGGESKPLTKPALIAAWDAICKKNDDTINKLAEGLPAEPTEENLTEYVDYLNQVVPIFRAEIDALAAVKPPQADQATIDEILSHLRASLTSLQEARSKAQAGDLDGFNAAGGKLGADLSAADQAAMNYGFKECGSA